MFKLFQKFFLMRRLKTTKTFWVTDIPCVSHIFYRSERIRIHILVLVLRLEECSCKGVVPDDFGVKELKKVTDNYEVCCRCS